MVFREMTIDECCELIWKDCPDTYAKSYASAWLNREHVRRGFNVMEARRSQACYLLSNITRWKGENAKLVRENLKRMAKA